MEEMRRNRILLISIVCISVLILLAFLGFAIINKASQRNKMMFYKYLKQTDLKSFLNDNKKTTFFDRIKTEKQSTEGSISIVVGEDINEKLDFSIKNNPEVKIAKGTFKYVKNDEEKLRVYFLKNDDLYGFKFKDITKNYLTIRNDESLSDLLEKIGIENFNSFDEVSNIIKTSLERIKDTIPNKKFSKIKEEKITIGENEISAGGYALELTSAELKENIEKCINDAGIEGNKNLVELLTSMKKILESSNFKLKILVYVQDKNPVKIVAKIDTSDENKQSNIEVSLESNKMTINISKQQEENKANYKMELENVSSDEQEKYTFKIVQIDGEEKEIDVLNAEYTVDGINTEEAEFKAKLNTSLFGEKTKIELNGKTTFGKEVGDAQLNEENTIILNDLTYDKLENLVNGLDLAVSKNVKYNNSLIGKVISILKNIDL